MLDLGNVGVNVPQVRLEDYVWVVAGIPKSGKTTLYAKLIEEYFNDASSGMLLAFEKGYQALRVRAVDVPSWASFVEIVEQLVLNKEKLGIKMLGIDTADILYEYAQDEVIREWNKSNPLKRTNDIGGVGAKGTSTQGFGLGYSLIKKKIREQVDKLVKAGYGLMVLTHSKDKKVEQRDGTEYDQLNVSLPSSAREVFINMADFIVFLTSQKVMENKELVTKRFMYFRSDGYVEAGSRFPNVPERIEYDLQGFLDTFKHAVESEFEKGVSLEDIKKEQAERRESDAASYIEKVSKTESPTELIAEITSKITDLPKSAKSRLQKSFVALFGNNGDYNTVEDVETLKSVLSMVEDEAK